MAGSTYNGWANYETWLVNLWMDNDQGSQEFFRERAAEIYGEVIPNPGFTREVLARLRFADWLKDHHSENMPDMPGHGLYYDLLLSALSEVNWDEIARQYIDTVKEETHADG